MSELERPLRVWLPAVRAGSGADVFVERLAAGLKRAGHEAIVQWFPHCYELMPWLLKRVPTPPGIDIVHASSWQGFAFKRNNVPLVVTEHHFVLDPEFAPYRSFAQSIYHEIFVAQCLKRSYLASDAIVGVSRHTAQAVKKRFGHPVTVIYNWLDVEDYRRTIPERPGNNRHAHPFRLLFVGNPSRRKGADLLPEVATRLGRDFEIWCMGGLRKSFKPKHGLKNLVPIPSVPAEEMPKIYTQVDAVLVLARYEAFGYVALEAMACGKPVVGFNNTGTCEICINGQTALLVPTGNVDKLIETCRKLASDTVLANTISSAGAKRVADRFDEPHAVSYYTRVYETFLHRRSG